MYLAKEVIDSLLQFTICLYELFFQHRPSLVSLSFIPQFLNFFLLSLSLGKREEELLLFCSKGDYFKVYCFCLSSFFFSIFCGNCLLLLWARLNSLTPSLFFLFPIESFSLNWIRIVRARDSVCSRALVCFSIRGFFSSETSEHSPSHSPSHSHFSRFISY